MLRIKQLQVLRSIPSISSSRFKLQNGHLQYSSVWRRPFATNINNKLKDLEDLGPVIEDTVDTTSSEYKVTLSLSSPFSPLSLSLSLLFYFSYSKFKFHSFSFNFSYSWIVRPMKHICKV